MRGQLDRRIDVAVIQVPGLVVTDRLAAAAAENLLAAPDPLLPLPAVRAGTITHITLKNAFYAFA